MHAGGEAAWRTAAGVGATGRAAAGSWRRVAGAGCHAVPSLVRSYTVPPENNRRRCGRFFWHLQKTPSSI